MKEEYKEIKSGDLSKIRQELYDAQSGVCPILKQNFPIESFVVDHQHRLNKSQKIGEDGAGLIRGAIQRHANALEGKIVNNWRRNGMDKFDISLPDFLRNLADYLERPNTDIVHPTELPGQPKIKKSNYNKLLKVLDDKDKTKIPAWKEDVKSRHRMKMTKPLEKLYEKYNITPEFY